MALRRDAPSWWVSQKEINWDATFLTFEEVVFKRFQPELWVYLQDSESRKRGSISEDEGLGIKNHDAKSLNCWMEQERIKNNNKRSQEMKMY